MLTYDLADWRRSTDPDAEREILSLFADDPRAPYSLHNFVKHGAVACGKYPGEWFGPSATARCIQYVSLHLTVWGGGLPMVIPADTSQGFGEAARALVADIFDRRSSRCLRRQLHGCCDARRRDVPSNFDFGMHETRH